MMTEKTKVKREAVKPMKKKRKLSEETKEKLRVRLAEMRAKKKPAEYKNVAKSVLDLPDDDKYSFKNVKEWIKQSKLNVSTLTKTARGFRTPPQQKQQAANAAEHKKAYIRYCEYYLKTGDWIGMFSGEEETNKVVPKCVAMAYYPDGTPKRSVGVFYSDINLVWTNEMDEKDYSHIREDNSVYTTISETKAITDKQFTSNL
tara:strand:- start:653 stop:1258 length:606 start_codon:yes stop_codon:yes gene_type:complete